MPRVAAEQAARQRTAELETARVEVDTARIQNVHSEYQIVVNALGLKPAAGQALDSLVSLQEMPFQANLTLPGQLESVQGETRIQGWVAAASRWAAVGGAALVLLIFLRVLSRQKPEPVPVEVLSLTPEAAARSLPNANGITPELLNELIRQKPANVGVALRDWVSEAAPAPAGKN